MVKTPIHGYGTAVVIAAATRLEAAGAEGVLGADLGAHPDDKDGGFLVHQMRIHGFLVQWENRRMYILPEVRLHMGAWMRHTTHGLVKVRSYPDHLGIVRVQLLAGRGSVRVHKSELGGK